MNTRRDFVRGLTGIGAIVATGQAPAAIVRSMVGARNAMLANFGGQPMKQITLTQNCTNCKALADHIVSLLSLDGIKNSMCCIVANETRNNMVGIVTFINGSPQSACLRYRSGTWGSASTIPDYDADARVGDVYNVYVAEGLWDQS